MKKILTRIVRGLMRIVGRDVGGTPDLPDQALSLEIPFTDGRYVATVVNDGHELFLGTPHEWRVSLRRRHALAFCWLVARWARARGYWRLRGYPRRVPPLCLEPEEPGRARATVIGGFDACDVAGPDGHGVAFCFRAAVALAVWIVFRWFTVGRWWGLRTWAYYRLNSASLALWHREQQLPDGSAWYGFPESSGLPGVRLRLRRPLTRPGGRTPEGGDRGSRGIWWRLAGVLRRIRRSAHALFPGGALVVRIDSPGGYAPEGWDWLSNWLSAWPGYGLSLVAPGVGLAWVFLGSGSPGAA